MVWNTFRSQNTESGYNSRTAERRKEVVAGEDKHQQHYTHYGSDWEDRLLSFISIPFHCAQTLDKTHYLSNPLKRKV